MWIERFGQIDEKIFTAFCIVVAIITLLTFANVLVAIWSGGSPGQSVSSLLDFAVLTICASVLFRGIQTSWSEVGTFKALCQVYSALMVVGYTLFASVICIKSWAYATAFILKRECAWWINLIVATSLLVVAGSATIAWELVFEPEVYEDTLMTSSNLYNQSVLVCGDPMRYWSHLNTTDHSYQFLWRVATSSYVGAILVADVIALPLLCALQLPLRVLWIRPKQVALIFINVNVFLCIASGLAVWFAYRPKLSAHDVDNYMYAIIGGLQLWMLFFTQLAMLIARSMTTSTLTGCCQCKENYNTAPRSQNSTSRLVNHRKVRTLDRDTVGTLSVHDLDLYTPAHPSPTGHQVSYVNVPPNQAQNDTNTKRFKY